VPLSSTKPPTTASYRAGPRGDLALPPGTVLCYPSLRPPPNRSPAPLPAHAGLLSAARRAGPGSHARTLRCRAA
jgi:hypothetical protein